MRREFLSISKVNLSPDNPITIPRSLVASNNILVKQLSSWSGEFGRCHHPLRLDIQILHLRQRNPNRQVSGRSPLARFRESGIERSVAPMSTPTKLSSQLSAQPRTEGLGRPLTPAPAESKARTELAKQQLRRFHPGMVSQSVNKTALHPGGVL